MKRGPIESNFKMICPIDCLTLLLLTCNVAIADIPVVMTYEADSSVPISSDSFTPIGGPIVNSNTKVASIGFSAAVCSRRCQAEGK